MRLVKSFLYNLFPYRHVARAAKKFNRPSHYKVLAAGPRGVSVPAHIYASTTKGIENSELTPAEIIKQAGLDISASVNRATLYWDKTEILSGYNRYYLYLANENIPARQGNFYPQKYFLYFADLKLRAEYRLTIFDSSNKKEPLTISFKTITFENLEKPW